MPNMLVSIAIVNTMLTTPKTNSASARVRHPIELLRWRVPVLEKDVGGVQERGRERYPHPTARAKRTL